LISALSVYSDTTFDVFKDTLLSVLPVPLVLAIALIGMSFTMSPLPVALSLSRASAITQIFFSMLAFYFCFALPYALLARGLKLAFGKIRKKV
jgi:hypothetical protein